MTGDWNRKPMHLRFGDAGLREAMDPEAIAELYTLSRYLVVKTLQLYGMYKNKESSRVVSCTLED